MRERKRLRLRVLKECRDCVYRRKGCTVFLIERAGWEGNEFRLWLPEDVVGWRNWGPDAIQDWRTLEDGRLEWRHSVSLREADPPLEVDLSAGISADQENDCLWYSITATNTGDAPTDIFRPSTCFQLFNAPEFISIRGERLWACLDGKWTTTDTVPREKSRDPRRVRFLREGLRKERTVVHNEGFPFSTMPEAAGHPLIMAESRDGGKCVGIASGNMGCLFNNNDPVLRCIHSDPLVVEGIPVGGRAEAKGVILFCDGNHEALLERFEGIVPDGWWRGRGARA